MANELQEQIAEYKRLVAVYQDLDKTIDNLLMSYGGHSENMPPDAIQRYRDLARQRDEVYNAMRELEQILFLDDSQSS